MLSIFSTLYLISLNKCQITSSVLWYDRPNRLHKGTQTLLEKPIQLMLQCWPWITVWTSSSSCAASLSALYSHECSERLL